MSPQTNTVPLNEQDVAGGAHLIGRPTNRVDGPLKVTGRARYAAEFAMPRLAHATFVQSTITKGRVISIDTSAAETLSGVLAVLTHLNMPELAPLPDYFAVFGVLWTAQSHWPMQGSEIYHNGQCIAVVVGESLEIARYAAGLVKAEYAEADATPSFAEAVATSAPEFPSTWEVCRARTDWSVITTAHQSTDDSSAVRAPLAPHETIGEGPDWQHGDAEAGLRDADVVVDVEYRTPTHHHCSMELHSTTAAWDGDHLLLHDSSAAITGVQNVVSHALRSDTSDVRVVAPFVGGSFGHKGRVWPHETIAAVAARAVGRPVRLTLTRRQTFTAVGHRSPTHQRVRLGARADGTLLAIAHDSVQEAWPFEVFAEPSAAISRTLYACPNIAITHRVIRVDAPKSSMTHSPGDLVGSYAIESAMDELAERLQIDPLDLRLRNYADADPMTGNPYTTKRLKDCYSVGAARFGWERRSPAPRSMRHPDGALMGFGMGTAIYPCTYRQPATATARVFADGSASVRVGGSDQGAGSYTAYTLIAAETLGIDLSRVRAELGDTNFPQAPPQVAAMQTESIGPAIQAACLELRGKIIGMAVAQETPPLKGRKPEDIVLSDGRLFARGGSEPGMDIQAVLAGAGNPFTSVNDVEATARAAPGPESMRSATYSFGAVFAEVHVDPDLGQVRVTRMTGVYDAGRVVNPKTARSQFIGGMTWSIGHALSEETLMDAHHGRYVNGNLADYHVATHADVPDLDVAFLDGEDYAFNPVGVKTLGEIGVIGAVAAISNAVYHATGVRVRSLPLLPDKLVACANASST